jgi:hypothetical protein
MKKSLLVLAVVAAHAAAAAPAHAHTRAFGYIPQGGGTVDFYIGTYGPGHPSFPLEGSLVINGPVSVVAPFDTNYLPTTLPEDLGLRGPGAAPGAFYVENTTSGPIVAFQSVRVGGLVSGDYSFNLTGFNDVSYFVDSATPVLGGLSIGVTTTPAPEPTSMALFGMGALGLGVIGRRRRKAKSAQAPSGA